MMWLITSQWVTRSERHVWWSSCALCLLNRCVDDKIFCHISKWRNHGWGELRKPRWEHNKLCPYDKYRSLWFAAVVTHRLYEWQVTRWEGLSLLGLWTLQTVTQAQYRGQQSTFGNQVKPVRVMLSIAEVVQHWAVFISTQTTWLEDATHVSDLAVGVGLCSNNEKTPVLFGENSTSGCLLLLSRQNLTQCNLLRSVT